MNKATVRAIITDIEGTTTALSFVKETLFPYAHQHLTLYVKNHLNDPGVRQVLDDVRQHQNNPSLTTEEIIDLLLHWIEEDKKITPLKTLQGMIWEEGYRSRTFTTHIYDDAALRLNQWHAAGIPLYVYSSGSIYAQKLLFRYSPHGDLTPLFAGYFDTTIGNKREQGSYTKIASDIGLPPQTILFLSDIIEELDAARTAGLKTTLLDRERCVQDTKAHPRVYDFSTILLSEAA